jgi:hypothetical protein
VSSDVLGCLCGGIDSNTLDAACCNVKIPSCAGYAFAEQKLFLPGVVGVYMIDHMLARRLGVYVSLTVTFLFVLCMHAS